ncbi:DUF1428 family protein [Fictibacillus barbaricus]|uniref:DUF1428 domain-containing protein n=1 Tax=Fictibacillus barbaricus TaxID=182136 RepID=A0ABS2ZDW3_9BACL|nr:DUF1428 family protein [Fictibacillus barbaricus]MBN3544811.1 hypothetical protein [Fictibacillus barbaricus]GGB63874.1 hypothetical protein GCM10007199_32420 [Fictibacillus barbaricus]
MAYLLVYFYRLTPEVREKFLEISAQTNKKFQEYGGVTEQIFKLSSSPKNYGISSISDKLKVEDNEELWIGLLRFQSEEHARITMEDFDQDPEVNELLNEFIAYVAPLEKLVFGEFVSGQEAVRTSRQ